MIYYSHVNEDSRVERKLLQSSGCSTVVAIAGSGERVIALMDYAVCNHFYVVDVNADALHLLALKLAVLENYPVETYLGFCGYRVMDGRQRLGWFEGIESGLSPECRHFWEARKEAIANGIAYAGHFEIFLGRIRPLLRFYLGRSFYTIFDPHKAGRPSFPAVRWKWLMKLFAQRGVYKISGNKDIAFVSPDAATAHIPIALNRVICNKEAASCFMAQLIFMGHTRCMQEADLPPSLQPPVLQRVKERLLATNVNIHYLQGDILDCTEKINSANVFYSVSDILSFADHAYLQQLLAKMLRPGNQVVWRSFLRNRSANAKDLLPAGFVGAFKDCTEEESTRMYQVFFASNFTHV